MAFSVLPDIPCTTNYEVPDLAVFSFPTLNLVRMIQIRRAEPRRHQPIDIPGQIWMVSNLISIGPLCCPLDTQPLMLHHPPSINVGTSSTDVSRWSFVPLAFRQRQCSVAGSSRENRDALPASIYSVRGSLRTSSSTSRLSVTHAVYIAQ